VKTLSATLTAAIKARAFHPVVEVVVDDRAPGTPRARWSLWYEGISQSHDRHVAYCEQSGYLLQLAGTHDNKLEFRRLLPTASGGASWTTLATDCRVAQVAICATTAKIWVFWVSSSDDKTIKYRTSTDNGSAWAAAANVVVPSGSNKVRSLAAVCPGNGLQDCVLLYCMSANEDNDAVADKDVRSMYYASGAWAGDASWGRSMGTLCKGLAAVQYSSTGTATKIYFTVCGKFEVTSSGSNVNVYYLTLTAAHARTFTHLGTALQSQATAYAWSWPSMMPETTTERTRIFLQRYDPGAASGKCWRSGSIYVQELLEGDPAVFGDWALFDSRHEYTDGCAMVGDYLIKGGRLESWKASKYQATTPYRCTVPQSRIIAIEHHLFDNTFSLEDVNQPGYGYITLANYDGALNSLGEAGDDYEAIKRGAQVIVKLGYKTTAGDEVEALPPLWIDRIIKVRNPQVVTGRGLPRVTLEDAPVFSGDQVILACYDSWTMIVNRTAAADFKRQATPRSILTEVFGLLGFKYSDDGTDRLGTSSGKTLEKYRTRPGASYFPMIKEILKHTLTRVKFYTDLDEEGTWPTVRVYVFKTMLADEEDLHVGGSGEVAVYAAAYVDQDRWQGSRWSWKNPPDPIVVSPYVPQGGTALSGVYLEGKGVADEYVDFDSADRLAVDQPLIVVDYNITGNEYITPAQRASFAAAEVVAGMSGGSLVMPAHPGLELWDLLEIEDARALSAAVQRRVVAIETYYDTREKRGRCDQVVHLFGKDPW
jgi:hypothetical protein